MPKQKTHKGARKRFRVTSKGRIKRWKSGKRHLLLCKSSKRLRKLRQAEICSKPDSQRVRELLCCE